MAEVSAHVVARFPASAGGGGGLVIEADPGVYTGNDVHLLISPPATATSIVADIGSTRLGSVKPVPVQSGILQVSGAVTANLPRFVGNTAPTFQVLFAFDAETGAETEIGINYNALTNELRLSKAAYAAIRYSDYQSRAQELIYTPEINAPAGGVVSVRYGTIAAFAPPDDMVIYPVDISTVEDGNVEFEVYRITSQVIGNNTGIEYEKPPNYPTSGAYPDPVTFVLELEGTFMTKRLHEIGFMDSFGRAWVRNFWRANLEPYLASDVFVPVKTIEPSPLPEDRFDPRIILKAKNWIAAKGQGKI